jgi:hypothetical protein
MDGPQLLLQSGVKHRIATTPHPLHSNPSRGRVEQAHERGRAGGAGVVACPVVPNWLSGPKRAPGWQVCVLSSV